MEKNRAWTTLQKLRIPIQALILLVTVFSTGCRESPSLVKEGGLFASPEKASPGRALAYVYWPREEQGRQERLRIETCEGLGTEILPGGYVTFDLTPGPGCFNVSADLGALEGDRVFASVNQDLGSVELNAEPGRTLFIRLEQKRVFLISRINPRPVEPAIAGPEIRKCRQTVPLTPEELDRQFLQEMEREEH